jgi:hypothetical protein
MKKGKVEVVSTDSGIGALSYAIALKRSSYHQIEATD